LSNTLAPAKKCLRQKEKPARKEKKKERGLGFWKKKRITAMSGPFLKVRPKRKNLAKKRPLKEQPSDGGFGEKKGLLGLLVLAAEGIISQGLWMGYEKKIREITP